MKKSKTATYEEPKVNVNMLSRRYSLSIALGGKNYHLNADIAYDGRIDLANGKTGTKEFVFRNSNKETVEAIAKLMLEACKLP